MIEVSVGLVAAAAGLALQMAAPASGSQGCPSVHGTPGLSRCVLISSCKD